MKRCPKCGYPNPDNLSVCHNCKGPLPNAQSARRFSTAPPPPPPNPHNLNTGRGYCPQCRSRNITEFKQDLGGGDRRAPEAACCIGFCLFWPLALLAPFLGKKPVTGLFRQCNSCGHKWSV